MGKNQKRSVDKIMVDLFKSPDDVLTTIKSALQTFSITKNQITIIEKDSEDLETMHIKSKNGKIWKVKVEEEEK